VVPAAKAEDATGAATGSAKEPPKIAADPADAVIELYAWDDTRPASSAHVVEGGIDLAAVFPELWTATPRLLYAQLKVGETKIGSPVVLQPMVTPRKAQLFNAQTRQAWFVDPKTGKKSYVFSCFNQDQELDRVDWPALDQRLKQNSTQEKLTAAWLRHCLTK
jgi:hypothetical protein